MVTQVNNLQRAIEDYIFDPENPEKNYILGLIYESMGQTASAVSFFLRTAERTDIKELSYECLLKMGLCFDRQGNRSNTVKGMYKQALVFMPDRPEAYFLLSRHHERAHEFVDAYVYAELGLKKSNLDCTPLRGNVEYPGKYGLPFEKAVAGWWWGRPTESRKLFRDISDEYFDKMDQPHYNAVNNNLHTLGIGPEWVTHKHYDQSKHSKLRYKFPGSEKITKTHAQVFQDLFVLSMLNGKREGSYLEVGSAGPYYGNNTALLEQEFNWSGIGIDFDQNFVNDYRKHRRNPILQQNALEVNYEELLSTISKDHVVDYLQLDCEPSETTYNILLKIPFDKYKFAVITYEHDHYLDMTKSFRRKSREYLASKGYVLVVPDVSPEGMSSFEDWWVHPDLVDRAIIDTMKVDIGDITHIEKYIFPEVKQYWHDFQWGPTDPEYVELFTKENFIEETYQKHYRVKENDVVMDIGANCGSFSYSILSKKPQHIYCLEPSNRIVKCLEHNLKDAPATIINKAIDNVETTKKLGEYGVYIYENDGLDYETTTFKKVIEENNITKIDFLKFDCEGGEYSIFTEENYDFIVNNVGAFAGEWHIVNHPNSVNLFIKFRDMFLKKGIFDFTIYERVGTDVTKLIFDNKYLTDFEGWYKNTYHGQFIIYAENKKFKKNKTKTKPWSVTKHPTIEFTTNIAEKGCVVDCAFCPQRTLEKSYKSDTRILTLDKFKELIAKIPQEIRITFAGFTEPFLNKNCTDMILHAHEKGHEVAVFTTGVGMTPQDVIRLKDIPFAGEPNGGFVLHLPDQERIAKHPINKNYIKTIETFKEHASSIKNFYTMCMSNKVHESVRHLFSDAVVPAFWNRAGNLLGEAIIKPDLESIKNRVLSAPVSNVPVTCGCVEDLYHNVVLPNGDVSLCCMDYSLNTILGNLFESEYEDIAPRPKTCFEICRSCENGVRK